MSKEDKDPLSDYDAPRLVPFEDISAAAYRIKSGIIRTPCVPSHMNQRYDMKIYLKCEFMQVTGSFKERGARNTMLQMDKESRKKGVIGASLGNHSQGLSYHGKDLGIPVTVVMPVVAPLMKVSKCRAYGANVVLFGTNMAMAKEKAFAISKEKGMTFVNGYDHPTVIAGQGTIGLEILEQVPDVDAVLIPCGGGGLLSGICIAVKQLKPQCLIYGVETEKCASMAEAFKAGKPVNFDVSSTLADGLAVGKAGPNSFKNLSGKLDKMVVVSEDWTARSILNMIETEKYVVEGGGAVACAAIMAGLVPELKGKSVVCVLSGGNIDTTLLSRCIDRGLAAEQRLVKFKVNISDRPGSFTELFKTISDIGVSVKDISQERAWLKSNIFLVRAKVICETRGPEHMEELRNAIAKNYTDCYFPRKSFEAHASLTDSLTKVRPSSTTTKK